MRNSQETNPLGWETAEGSAGFEESIWFHMNRSYALEEFEAFGALRITIATANTKPA